MVRTLPFHGKNTGSNPVRDINFNPFLYFTKNFNLYEETKFLYMLNDINLESVKFFNSSKNDTDIYSVPVSHVTNNTHNLDLNKDHLQFENLSSRSIEKIKNIDIKENTRFLHESFGDAQARTLGDKYLYEPGNVLDMNDPVLQKIRMYNMSVKDNTSLEIGLKQCSNFIYNPASAYSTDGYMNIVCCNNPNYYNNLYNTLESFNFKKFCHPYNWNYVQQHIVDLTVVYDPWAVASNFYFQRRKTIIEGCDNITNVDNYDNITSGVAEGFLAHFEFNISIPLLCELMEKTKEAMCYSAQHVPPGLTFVMFCTLMRFDEWAGLQPLMFIKDHFLVFIKSILFKIKTYSIMVPDFIKTKMSRCYGIFLRLNNCKLFLGFSMKTSFILSFLDNFASIFPSDMLKDIEINETNASFIKNFLSEETCNEELKEILLTKSKNN